MKILHLSKFYPPFQGGMELFLYDLNEALHQHTDLQSDVLCFNEHQTNETDTAQGYLIQRAALTGVYSSMPISVSYLTWLLRNHHHYDILHIHVPNPFANVALLLSRFRGKVVVHWHCDVVKSAWMMALYRPFQSAMLRRADAIIVTSPNYAAESVDLQPYSHKLQLVPLALNTERMQAANPQQVAALRAQYPHQKIAFSLGRQVPYKGYQYLIEAAALLPDDYVILIGGKGELYDAHRQLIVQQGLSHKVKMLGFVQDTDLATYYAACDVYVMSSITRAEAFGVVQLEAMYYHRPLVSTSIECSGVGWVNKNGETGCVVPPCNAPALAQAIITACTNPLYGTQARNRLDTVFSMPPLVASLTALYGGLLEAK